MREIHKVTRVSPISGEHTLLLIFDIVDYDAWYKGKKCIQDAMPYMSKENREFLMTGLTPNDWEQIFGKDASHE